VSACYLDASAIVKLAVHEAESQALRSALEAYVTRVTSRLAEVEVGRALLRRSEASAAALDDVRRALENMFIIEVDPDIASAAGRVRPVALRSLDALHLASALSIRAELDAFVTYDLRLAYAARAAGLEVVAPN
jgi:predicted nucleic acid-binding protein